MDPSRERALTALFFVLVAMPLLGVFPYMRWLNNPNEHTRTFTTMALVESGSFEITAQIERYGMTGDLASRKDEETGAPRYFGVKAPLTSFMGVPVYALFRVVAPALGLTPPEEAKTREEHERWLERATLALRFFAVQLPSLFFLIFFERFLRRGSADLSLRLSAVGAVGLGSNFFAYATMFTSHALFACAAFASFALTTMERERTPDPGERRLTYAFLAALAASACTLLEYHAATVSLALGLYAVFTFRRPSGVAACAAAAAVCAAPLLVYHHQAFGHPLATGHTLQVDPGLAAHHVQGVNGVSLPSLRALGALTFDPGFGALVSSPFLLLGLFALPFGLVVGPAHAESRRRERITLGVLFVTMLGLFLLASGVYNWRGGWSIGPRYLGAAPPFFAYAAVRAAENFAGDDRGRRHLTRALALGFFLASLFVTGSVALLINTLPEAIARPFPQFAIPMWTAGFSPHHLLELAGMEGGWPFYMLALAAGLSACVVMLAAVISSPGRRASLLVLVALFGGVAVTPALVPPPGHDEREVAEAVALLSRRWEPRGRDRIARIAAEIARGERDPCDRFELAHLQRSVGMIAEAERSMRVAKSKRCEARE